MVCGVVPMLSDGPSEKPHLSKPRLLFLAHLLPWPLNGGGQIKSYHTLRLLAGAFDITLLSFVRPGDDVPAALSALGPLCVGGVQTVPLGRTRFSNAWAAFSALASGRSFLVLRDESRAMHHAVGAALASHTYAVLHADHLPMMAFVPPDTGQTRVVLDNHNIEHRIIQRIAETPGTRPATRFYAGCEWPKLRAFELAACRRADIVLTVSDEDAQGLQRLDTGLVGKIAAVPIGVDTAYFAPYSHPPAPSLIRTREGESETNTGISVEGPSGSGDSALNELPLSRSDEGGGRGVGVTLLSIGTLFWPPNVDGAQWFCRDVLPIIKTAVPDVCFHLVGARPNKEIYALAQNDPAHVRVFGSVPDVRPFAQNCGAFVVPLRSGSGMRVKILNAFAMRLPVVSTTLGAEGITYAKNGEHFLLADTPQEFADACVRVLQDRAFAARIAQVGRDLAETGLQLGRHRETPAFHLPVRDKGRRKVKILYVLPYVPSPIRVRPFQIIRHLAQLGHEITLVALDDGLPIGEAAMDELKAACRVIYLIPHPKWQAASACFASLPTRTPLWAAYCQSRPMARLLRQLTGVPGAFDVVHIEHLRAAHFAPHLNGLPAVLDAVDCITALRRQMLDNGIKGVERALAWEEWAKLKRYEPRIYRPFDQIAVTSPHDADALRALDDALPPVTVVPNGVDAAYFTPDPNVVGYPSTLVFSGKMSYYANEDAARFLINEILPHVRASFPLARLLLVGSSPTTALRDLAKKAGHVEVTGYVDDMRPHLQSAVVAVCPMRIAVGIQNKALESLALELPVVCTPLVARAFPGAEETGVLRVADGPDAIADACVSLLTHPDEAHQMGQNGRRFVQAHWAWETCAHGFVRLYEAAISARQASAV